VLYIILKENLCSFRNLLRSVLWALLSDERPFLKNFVNCEWYSRQIKIRISCSGRIAWNEMSARFLLWELLKDLLTRRLPLLTIGELLLCRHDGMKSKRDFKPLKFDVYRN
jgi:hypothetical protein